MKKLLYLLTVILIFPVLLLAAEVPTVEELLNKVSQQTQARDELLQDISYHQIVVLETSAENTLTTAQDVWLKYPDKYKVMSYDEEGNLLETSVYKNGEIAVKDYKGELFTKKLSETLTTEERAELRQKLDDIKLPGSMRFENDPQRFLQDYHVTIDTAKSKPAENAYVLRVKNKLDPQTGKEKENDIFSSMEIETDFGKGVVLSRKIYGPNQILLIEDIFSEYTQVTTIPGNFWYALKKEEKTVTGENQHVKKTVTLSNVQYNQGLADSIFEP